MIQNPDGEPSDSADKAQREADTMGMTPDDEAEARKRLDDSGEPVRDEHGRESGSS